VPRGTDRYDEARVQGRLWTPKVWKGDAKLVAWYDFSNENGGLTYATGVSDAVDLSGKGNNATQPVGSAQAPWSPNVLNSKGAILPNDIDGYNLTNALTYNATNGLSAACICYNNGSGVRVIFSHAASTGSPNIRFNGDQFELVRNFQASLLLTAAGTCPTGVRIVGCDFQSNSCVAWIDGTSYSNSTDPGFGSTLAHLFNDNGTSFWVGDPFGEILIGQSRWTVRDRSLVDGYLAWKWGNVSNLVASHPFKNRPPLIGD
jgi:hypothetical protein